MTYILDRLAERSTWQGLVALLGAFSVALRPDLTEAVVDLRHCRGRSDPRALSREMSLWPFVALIALAASAAGAIWLAGRSAGAAVEAAIMARDEAQSLKDTVDAEGRMLDASCGRFSGAPGVSTLLPVDRQRQPEDCLLQDDGGQSPQFARLIFRLTS